MAAFPVSSSHEAFVKEFRPCLVAGCGRINPDPTDPSNVVKRNASFLYYLHSGSLHNAELPSRAAPRAQQHHRPTGAHDWPPQEVIIPQEGVSHQS